MKGQGRDSCAPSKQTVSPWGFQSPYPLQQRATRNTQHDRESATKHSITAARAAEEAAEIQAKRFTELLASIAQNSGGAQIGVLSGNPVDRVDMYISIIVLAWSIARSHEIDLSAIAIRRENCSL